MSVVPMLLGKESFPIHSQLSPNPILKYVMRQHCIYNRVDSISLIFPLVFFVKHAALDNMAGILNFPTLS